MDKNEMIQVVVTPDLICNKEFKFEKNKAYSYDSRSFDSETFTKIDNWFNYHILMDRFPSLGEFVFAENTPDEFEFISYEENNKYEDCLDSLILDYECIEDNLAHLLYEINGVSYVLGDKNYIDSLREDAILYKKEIADSSEDELEDYEGLVIDIKELKTFTRGTITYYLCD
jgi:hypothetical protein